MEPSHDDGFKWFGEGFEGFPKHLPDDTIEYCIYIIDERINANNSALRTRLEEILKATNKITKELLKEYIWQRDAFSLKLRDPAKQSKRQDAQKLPVKSGKDETTLPPHLHGRTTFGDSIADEWLIVYILRELSRKCTDAWIRVSDTDGEFLLIEAANALPKWLNPDIAENRVWLHNGHLEIIPLDGEDGLDQRNVDVEKALHFISTQRDKLIISPFIEDAAFARLNEYPQAVEESLHHALVTIPRRLAYILKRNAAYISPAIEAFYLRDPVALRPLTTKDIATLRFPPEDFVSVSVKFTKVGYAQLRGQVFDAPPAWTGILPRLKDEKVQIGMKLACGFEMLLADPGNRDKREAREIELLLGDVESGDEQLPSDAEISGWSTRQDDEKWLDINYKDFEAELSGHGGDDAKGAKKTGGETGSAQDNLRKMVSRVQDFIKEDAAGVEGIDDDEDDDDEDSDEEVSSSGEDKDGSFDDAEFERAMKEMMGMSDETKEESGLLEEARRLAIADGENDNQEDDDEDEGRKKVMEMVEKELKGHGALGRDRKKTENVATEGKAPKQNAVFYGPVVPPGFRRQEAPDEESADEEVDAMVGDEELSSDDEEYNNVDMDLAKNLLESFKGQAGMSGPAGNMMRALGVNMPRDEDEHG